MKILTAFCNDLWHRHLDAETHPGEVVSAVIIFVFLLATIACSIQTARLSPDVYINLNNLFAAANIIRTPWNEASGVGGCKWSLPGYPQGQSKTCYQE